MQNEVMIPDIHVNNKCPEESRYRRSRRDISKKSRL